MIKTPFLTPFTNGKTPHFWIIHIKGLANNHMNPIDVIWDICITKPLKNAINIVLLGTEEDLCDFDNYLDRLRPQDFKIIGMRPASIDEITQVVSDPGTFTSRWEDKLKEVTFIL